MKPRTCSEHLQKTEQKCSLYFIQFSYIENDETKILGKFWRSTDFSINSCGGGGSSCNSSSRSRSSSSSCSNISINGRGCRGGGGGSIVVVVVVVVVVVFVVVVMVGLGKNLSQMFQKTTFPDGPLRHQLGRFKPKTLLS